MDYAVLTGRIAAELALFAAAGFLIFALNDLAVDIIYFARRMWRALVIYSRYPRAFASQLPPPQQPGFLAIFIPAWDESAVIAAMLEATVARIEHDHYRIFVGHYRNDPSTGKAIATVHDPRIEPVLVDEDGPTTKAGCLNHLYDALIAYVNATVEAAHTAPY